MNHPLSGILKDFDLHSYYAGITVAFAEVVGAGCKPLALSSPYDGGVAEELLEASRFAATEYGVEIMVEPELIITKLFPSDVAKGKTVVLIAHDQGVLDEYMLLKKLKQKSDEENNPDDLEADIAKRFGALLGYDEATINRLLMKNG